MSTKDVQDSVGNFALSALTMAGIVNSYRNPSKETLLVAQVLRNYLERSLVRKPCPCKFCRLDSSNALDISFVRLFKQRKCGCCIMKLRGERDDCESRVCECECGLRYNQVKETRQFGSEREGCVTNTAVVG